MAESIGIFTATAMPDRGWWEVLWPEPEAVLRALGLERGMVTVDLCCGDGYFTAALARVTRGLVYGIDLDQRLLDLARTEMECAEISPCAFIRGDARELAKLVPEQVDYVFLANTFHGVDSKTDLARDVGTILRPGGRFGIVNWYRRPRETTVILGKPRGPRTDLRMTPEDTRGAVEPAGFELERLVDLQPYHYGAVFLKRS